MFAGRAGGNPAGGNGSSDGRHRHGPDPDWRVGLRAYRSRAAGPGDQEAAHKCVTFPAAAPSQLPKCCTRNSCQVHDAMQLLTILVGSSSVKESCAVGRQASRHEL